VILIIVSLYLILNIALIGSVGAEVLGASPAPIATAAGTIFTHSGEIVAFIGIIAMLSAMNAYIIATSRILHTLSERFSIPKIRNISRQGTPVNALVVGCAFSGFLLLVSNRFEALATISVITTLVPYIFFCITAWILVAERKARLVAAAGMVSTTAILFIYFVV
jgi:amino acid transporter